MMEILKKYNIKPSKKLGQNFLIDRGVLRKIVVIADLKSNDIVLEIGPGLGILTIELAKKAKRVIAVEKDRTLCQALENILKEQKINNVQVINKDVLKISNFQFLISNKIPNYKIIANLPYYITSPVIRKFLEADSGPEEMILMIQKEVAQRICSKNKMSILSIAVQFYAKPKIIAYVSKKSFYPEPKVDSAIVKIVPKLVPKINTEKFFKMIKTGFSSKRKMLKNNLNIKDSILKDLGINPKVRSEDLSIQDWLRLFHKLGLG